MCVLLSPEEKRDASPTLLPACGFLLGSSPNSVHPIGGFGCPFRPPENRYPQQNRPVPRWADQTNAGFASGFAFNRPPKGSPQNKTARSCSMPTCVFVFVWRPFLVAGNLWGSLVVILSCPKPTFRPFGVPVLVPTCLVRLFLGPLDS